MTTKEMTPQNQIKALAELDGWQVDVPNGHRQHTIIKPNGSLVAFWNLSQRTIEEALNDHLCDLSQYLTSRDAIIPLRVKVCNTPALKVAWLNHARTIIARRIKLVSDFDIASIKPDEDCESLLRATGLWRE